MKCPICKQPTEKEDNKFWPFCGERCKKTDLNKWAIGDYAIKGEPASDEMGYQDQALESLSEED
jgi:endogenous inhibitor of DNA gyrase (YacG/DUF329 family)